MAFTNEEIMRATELALKQYSAMKVGKSLNDGPEVLVIYNGIGDFVATYVVLVFDQPLSDTGISTCFTAFAVQGLLNNVFKNYPITGAHKPNPYCIALACANFSTNEGTLTVNYDATKPIYNIENKLAIPFSKTFVPSLAPYIAVYDTIGVVSVVEWLVTAAFDECFILDQQSDTINTLSITDEAYVTLT